MNIVEQHTLFKVLYDKVDSANKPNIQPVLVDFLLNDAVQTIVKQRYRGIPPKNEGFEESEKRRDDLASIVVQKKIELVKGYVQVYDLFDFSETQNYILPLKAAGTKPQDYPGFPNYWFYISNWIEIDFLFCNKIKHVNVPAKVMQQDDYQETRWFQITRANTEKPYLLLWNKQDPSDDSVDKINTVFELDLGLNDFNQGNTIQNLNFYLRYIRKPHKFGLVLNKYPTFLTSITNCPLPDEIHQEVVEVAVGKALMITEDPRLSSMFQTILNLSE